MFALDARLAAAAAYVRAGCVAADIGCDHGKLSVFLAETGLCRKVIAVDVRPQPLAQAQKRVALHGCSALVECRLGDGLRALRAGEADDIVIAGMSGVTICAILAAAPWAKNGRYRFIFVPTSKHMYLRAELAQRGFEILDEHPVYAAGRYYTVMQAAYTGVVRQADALTCAVGRAVHGPHARGYLAGVAQRVEKEAQGLAGAQKEQRQALAQQIRQIAEEIQ